MLFGIAELELNLKAQGVVLHHRRSIKRGVVAEQDSYFLFSVFPNANDNDDIEHYPWHCLAVGRELIHLHRFVAFAACAAQVFFVYCRQVNSISVEAPWSFCFLLS